MADRRRTGTAVERRGIDGGEGKGVMRDGADGADGTDRYGSNDCEENVGEFDEGNNDEGGRDAMPRDATVNGEQPKIGVSDGVKDGVKDGPDGPGKVCVEVSGEEDGIEEVGKGNPNVDAVGQLTRFEELEGSFGDGVSSVGEGIRNDDEGEIIDPSRDEVDCTEDAEDCSVGDTARGGC